MGLFQQLQKKFHFFMKIFHKIPTLALYIITQKKANVNNVFMDLPGIPFWNFKKALSQTE